MPDPTKDYKDWVLANLPGDVTYNAATARFVYNGHTFFTWKECKWYRDAIRKARKNSATTSAAGAKTTQFTRNNINRVQFEFQQSGSFKLVGDLYSADLAIGGGGGDGARATTTGSTPDMTYGSGSNGSKSAWAGSGGNGFMFLVVKEDEVKIE